jgi:HlyD family secretion protein
MDVKRDPAILKRKRRRQYLLGGVLLVAVAGVSYWVSRLEPAAPSVANSSLYYGTVKRGDIMREVHGAGTLVPEDIRWVSSRATGKVERVILRPGAVVKPGTVIMELSNPDLKQQVNDAKLAWSRDEAQLKLQQATMKTQRAREDSNVANAESQYNVAKSDLEANEILLKQGLVSELTVIRMRATRDQAKSALEMAKKQREMTIEMEESSMAPAVTAATTQKARYDQLVAQLDDLFVKSTMSGILQEVPVDVGQSVGAATNLARVSDPTRLKAEVRISEATTRDLAIGQLARVDTRNGIVKGHVSRIDPAATGGTVGVDVTLDDPLPAGARPAQSVDGTIELQRLVNVLYVESPTFGQENNTIQLFKVLPNRDAVRTPVKLGKRSVQFVEVVDGLQVGDQVILSDMSQYDGFEKVRISGS